jgi:predicted nucleic acid-binding Zn ribbon protein
MNYPYKCKNCGTEFTITMSVKKYETIVVYCPVCKVKNPNRTFYSNGFSIQYKDDGFTKFVGKE